MTRVCLVGEEGVSLPADLLAYETAREALSSYDLDQPWADAVAVETISLGAAVSLLNDLEWYLRRLIAESLVLEPSVSETEWLSQDLAAAIRSESVDPDDTGALVKVYGVVAAESGPPRLVEPMFARRVDGSTPEYDLREVDDTLVVRVTEAEFGGS